MRFTVTGALLALLAVDGVVASSWFGRTAYNKWHETELERWLSDNGVPYPTPADRKDLENLVKDNWNDKVVVPYNSWDIEQLQKYLSLKGEEVKKGTEKNKESLVQQVKAGWADTEDKTTEAYTTVSNWIFDSWTESQLKSFLDYHGIPSPQPRTRDTLLTTARSNYQTVANKVGETTAYPGDWLFKQWSDSDLKSWADSRGIPTYQGTKRNQLIANVRPTPASPVTTFLPGLLRLPPPHNLLRPVFLMPSSTPGLTASSRNGLTREVLRFPRAPSATKSLLLSAAKTLF